jgi:AbrB family looped-hinge helix DNA binding protein
MLTTVVKLNNRNQITLPKAAREALGINPGDRIAIVVDGEDVQLFPEPKVWSEYIYGLGKSMWETLGGGEQFLQKERAAW